jgi:hypothetical protein
MRVPHARDDCEGGPRRVCAPSVLCWRRSSTVGGARETLRWGLGAPLLQRTAARALLWIPQAYSRDVDEAPPPTPPATAVQ